MKKNALFLLLFLLPSVLFSAPAKYEIKFASVAPDGSTWMKVMQDLNDEIEEATKGEVRFKFYAGGVMGDEKDVLRKMKVNQLAAGGFTSQGLGEVVPDVRVLNLPLIFKTYEEVDRAMEKLTPQLEKKFEAKGYTVLGWPEVGFVYVFSKKKVESVNELRALKMWIWGDDVLVGTLFKNLGIVPVPLALVDVLQSLSTGLIEGVYISPLSCLAMQWNTKVNYMLDIKIAMVPGGILINKAAWSKLPDNYKIILKEKTAKACRKLTELSRKEDAEALMLLKKQGIKFTSVTSAEDMKIFNDVSMKTAADLTGKYYDKKLLDDMLAAVKENKKGK